MHINYHSSVQIVLEILYPTLCLIVFSKAAVSFYKSPFIDFYLLHSKRFSIVIKYSLSCLSLTNHGLGTMSKAFLAIHRTTKDLSHVKILCPFLHFHRGLTFIEFYMLCEKYITGQLNFLISNYTSIISYQDCLYFIKVLKNLSQNQVCQFVVICVWATLF